MRNLVCRDLDELHQELDLAVGRLRQKSHMVRSFFARVRSQKGCDFWYLSRRIAQNAVDFSVFKGVGSQILGDRRLA